MDPTERFSGLVLVGEDELDLAEAALCIAAHGDPAVDIAAELARFDDLAAGCPATLDGLVEHVWGTLGFAGDTTSYYDPRNSLLHWVVRRRKGIPITLAVVAMEIGRRAGVALEGVGMPGHYLLRSGPDFVDPFTGQRLDEAGCAELCRRTTGRAGFDPAWLEPSCAHATLSRILANLKALAVRDDDRGALVWITRLRCLVPGAPESERRELARLLA